MRWTLAATLLAAAAFASAESDVIDLDVTNFSSVVGPEPLMLVEFFAPWCGHCKALAPHYEEAATTLKDKSIPLAKVDCVDQAELCQRHGVQGYPTLKVFRNGTPTDYSGPRKADGIISFMVKQSLPAVVEVTSENHEEIIKADKMVLIAYLSASSDAPGPEFTATAEKHRDDYLFGATTDKDVIEAAGVTPPAIVLYRAFDEPRIDFIAHVPSATVEELEAFLKDNSVPLMAELDGENYQTYVSSGLPLAYLFVEPEDPEREEHIAAIKPVAQTYKGKINFVSIDAIKFGDHAKALNLREAKFPAFVVQDLTKQLKYPLDQTKDVTADAVGTWVQKYIAGELEPELKSEAVPTTQDESVFVLVGKQFDEVVFDDSKDVFIEFYAPWCGHCKRLKPTWDSLGDRYESFKDRLIIAKMDATENDLPPSVPFRIAGFPTLKFKQAGSREFIDYDGDRSLESLIDFVEAKAKNSLEVKTPVVAEQDTTPQEPVQVDAHDHDEL